MNKIKLLSGLLCLLLMWGMYSCTRNHETPIQEDSCMSLPARSFSFRKGIWIEQLDSISAIYQKPSSIIFISDSLMTWVDGNTKSVTTPMYFLRCDILNHQSSDSAEAARNVWIHSNIIYDKTDSVMSIIFSFFPEDRIIKYKKQ